MVPYFRNKSKEATSLYARYTLIDLVMEHSASDRTRARMDYLVCVNPSGIRGGFMFRDKYRASNEGRKSQHMHFRLKTVCLGSWPPLCDIFFLRVHTTLHDIWSFDTIFMRYLRYFITHDQCKICHENCAKCMICMSNTHTGWPVGFLILSTTIQSVHTYYRPIINFLLLYRPIINN